MPKRNQLSVAIGLLGVAFVATTVAFANPTWGVARPTPGAGSITVAGSFTVPTGKKTTGVATAHVWPSAGGAVKESPVSIAANQTGAVTWGSTTLSGYTAGTEYFVLVKIETTGGTYATDPATVTPTAK